MQSARSRTEFAMRLRQGIVLRDNYVQSEVKRKRRALDDFFLYTSVSGLRFLHSRNPRWFQITSACALILSLTVSAYHSWTFVERFLQVGHPAQMTTAYYRQVNSPLLIICPYKQFRMLEENYTGDFAFILTHLWREPAVEPKISGIPLGRFLNQTLEEVLRFLDRTANKITLNQLTDFTTQIGHVLPEIATFSNVSQAIHLLDANFQWENYNEYTEQKIQNDTCYKQRFKNASINEFYNCRLNKVHGMLKQTIANLMDLRTRLKRSPSINGFVLSCKWWDGSNCRFESILSPFGIKSIFLTTKVVIDTQVFNNQADGWEKNEIQVALMENGTLMPSRLNYFRSGGGSTLELEINSYTDFYYEGSCSDGPLEEACMWRRYNIDYSMTSYTGSSEFYEKVRMEREKTWRYIDNLIENSISDEMRRLFRDYFSATLLLGKIVQSTQVLKRNKPIPVSKSCAEVSRPLHQSLLMEDARHKVEELLSWIHAIETNATNRNLTVGFANTVRDDSHPITTKFIRYYSNPKNIALLGDYFDKLYELITTLRNQLVPGSVCDELVVNVRKFLTETSMVSRTSFNDKQSVLENRLTGLVQRRDAQLIYNDYVNRADEYTAFRLIADLGGTFGLYFGLSVLTFYEFLMFVFVKDAAEGTVKAPKRNQIYNLKERNQSLYELQIPPRPF
ncbi:hypothetical protein M3Y96_00136600 [Aphelenchoides besseyi]|nr:hypothetical protein M3Y96_00136600 [Aphelenchoides besseyi]